MRPDQEKKIFAEMRGLAESLKKLILSHFGEANEASFAPALLIVAGRLAGATGMDETATHGLVTLAWNAAHEGADEQSVIAHMEGCDENHLRLPSPPTDVLRHFSAVLIAVVTEAAKALHMTPADLLNALCLTLGHFFAQAKLKLPAVVPGVRAGLEFAERQIPPRGILLN